MAVLIIDFNDNYQFKYNVDIQETHFGFSRVVFTYLLDFIDHNKYYKQIILHTGVVYIKNRKPEPFCTISSNNEHSPFSVRAHLYPVVNYIKYS